MIKRISFENFRNLNSSFVFNGHLNIFVGKNNSGKTNVLDGIRIAFSSLTNDYCKIKQSDFRDSDDSKPIKITVVLEQNAIPSLNEIDPDGEKCGFIVTISKTVSGRYVRKVSLLNGSAFDMEIVREDEKIPSVCMIPLVRSEDIYSEGLITGISNFVDNDETYKNLVEESKKTILDSMRAKIDNFKSFCQKFNQNLIVELTAPKITDEKAYITEGDKPHDYQIGSGYKSIATIFLNALNPKFNIILIDEIENHLHPCLIRSLIRELRKLENCLILSTTHSAVVINEAYMEELIDISGFSYSSINPTVVNKLNTFLHPGRAELIFADNIILVEGYSEELLLNNYLSNKNNNWTVVNVAGIMFEPYIVLARSLNKKLIVVSDNDASLSATSEKSARFQSLEKICSKLGAKIIEVENTLESDLYNGGFLKDCADLIEQHKTHPEYYVAKQGKKTEIARVLIENRVDLSD